MKRPNTFLRSLVLALAVGAVGVQACPASAATASALAPTKKSHAVSPAPDWIVRVEPGELPKETTGSAAFAFSLVDDQVRLAEHEAHYTRRVVSLRTTEGVRDWSEIAVDLDPQNEKLAVHTIRITRDGKPRDVLADADVREFFVESNAENRIYDGRVRVLFVLKDVRVGDTLEVEYTKTGENPVYGGHYSRTFPVAFSSHAAVVQRRFLVPEGRPFAHKAFGAEVAHVEKVLGRQHEHVFRRTPAPAATFEDSVPGAFDTFPQVEVTTRTSWAEVVAWARSLFPIDEAPKGAVAAKIEELSKLPSANARALAAIRFVQDDIRYLGIEIGENTVRPHTPESVVAQRFGDCKDKATLLVMLLRGLGFQAHPVLVDTENGHDLAAVLPSGGVFDHAIVAVDLDGKRRFVDATIAHEGGRLEDLVAPDYGLALVLAKETTDLERMPLDDAKEPAHAVKEDLRVGADHVSATLVVETTYRRGFANAKRADLARRSLAALEKDAQNRRAADDAEVTVTAPFELRDDRDANVVVTVERYALPHFVRDGRMDVFPYAVAPALSKPRTKVRTLPLAVDHPFFARHEISIDAAGDKLALPKDVDVGSATLSFSSRGTSEGSKGRLVYELRTKARAVPAKDVPAYLRNVDTANDAVYASVGLVVTNAPQHPSRELAYVFGGFFGFVVVFVAGSVTMTRLQERRRRARSTPKAGESAQSAVVVVSREEAERDFAKVKCVCGLVEGDPSFVVSRLGEGEVLTGKATCTCGETRRRYYTVRGSRGAA